MSLFDQGWNRINHATRMRLGLHWKSRRPTLADIDRLADAIVAVLVVLAVLFLYGWLDANDQAVAERISADRSTQQFASFLNGGVITDQAGTFAAKCENLITVTN
jgi:hypothetical protein